MSSFMVCAECYKISPSSHGVNCTYKQWKWNKEHVPMITYEEYKEITKKLLQGNSKIEQTPEIKIQSHQSQARPQLQQQARPQPQLQQQARPQQARPQLQGQTNLRLKTYPITNKLEEFYNKCPKIKTIKNFNNNGTSLCYMHSMVQLLLSNPYFIGDLLQNQNILKNLNDNALTVANVFNPCNYDNFYTQFTDNVLTILSILRLNTYRQDDADFALSSLDTVKTNLSGILGDQKKQLTALQVLCPSMLIPYTHTLRGTTEYEFNNPKREPVFFNIRYGNDNYIRLGYSTNINTDHGDYKTFRLPTCIYKYSEQEFFGTVREKNDATGQVKLVKLPGYHEDNKFAGFITLYSSAADRYILYYLSAVIYKIGNDTGGHYKGISSRIENGQIKYYETNDIEGQNVSIIELVSTNHNNFKTKKDSYYATSFTYCALGPYKEGYIFSRDGSYGVIPQDFEGDDFNLNI